MHLKPWPLHLSPTYFRRDSLKEEAVFDQHRFFSSFSLSPPPPLPLPPPPRFKLLHLQEPFTFGSFCPGLITLLPQPTCNGVCLSGTWHGQPACGLPRPIPHSQWQPYCNWWPWPRETLTDDSLLWPQTGTTLHSHQSLVLMELGRTHHYLNPWPWHHLRTVCWKPLWLWSKKRKLTAAAHCTFRCCLQALYCFLLSYCESLLPEFISRAQNWLDLHRLWLTSQLGMWCCEWCHS